MTTQTGGAAGRFYLPQLDGLRFCAFLLVFLHHAPVVPGGSRMASAVKEFGFVGVDLFFVLSAYLLIALLDREHAATGTADVKKFFVRRILRIWPLFYVYVGACVLYFMASDGENAPAIAGRTIGLVFFLDNFFTAFDGSSNPLEFAGHLWTIAFEEQVYLFIPLLFGAIVGLRRHRGVFALTALAVAASQPLLRWGLAQVHQPELTVWVTPFLHFDTILAGLLLGAGAGTRLARKVPGDVLIAIGVLALALILLALLGGQASGQGSDWHVYSFSLLAAAFFLIVRGCLSDRAGISWLLSRQPLVFLGRISYGLYVWHLAGLEFGPRLLRPWLSAHVTLDNDLVEWSARVVPAFLLTVALSVTSYFALERPFLRLKRRFTVVPNRAD